LRVLLVNQAFRPDTVSSGQHAADLAEGLARAGHAVTVVTGRRAYDDPSRIFPAEEEWRGVRILRVPSTGLGKGARWRRAIDFGSFLLTCFFRLLLLPKFDVTIAMTSPPLVGALAAAIVQLKGGALVSWILDLNPDEAIAAGWLSETSVVGQTLESLLRFCLRASARIFVMDRFMAARVATRGVAPRHLAVMPPWSHSEKVVFDPEGREEFRRQQGLTDKFVVMYSGNHSPCHPLDTLLSAALALRDDPAVIFLFVGGGSEFRKVANFAAENQLTNIRQLPYQLIDSLAASLSAADLHAVVMGEPFVGIVHTCKVYNILSLGIPFVYIGPGRSHIMDLASSGTAAVWMHHALAGDTTRVLEIIRHVNEMGPYPRRWEQAVSKEFAQETILPRMIREIEKVAASPDAPSPPDLQPPPAEGEVFGAPELIDDVLRELHKSDH
jgi:colanic acid biosynthesis glycosyl transferase WcaI